MRISDLAAVLFGVTVNSILLWQKGLGEIGYYKIVMAKKDLFKYSEHWNHMMLQESPVLEFSIEYLMRSSVQSFFLILPPSS